MHCDLCERLWERGKQTLKMDLMEKLTLDLEKKREMLYYQDAQF